MKITRNNTILDLKPAAEVTITLANPLFNDTGSFSYPFDTPATPEILAAIGFPNRPDRHHRYVNKAKAILEHGLLRISGTHNISAVDRHADIITNDFIADEGAFYEEIGDRMLAEVMRTKLIPPNTTVPIVPPVPDEKYLWLRTQLQSANQNVTNPTQTLNYDFCAFPCCIATNELDDEATEYIFLNKTDDSGNIIFGTTGADGTGSINPNGVTPFLFVRTILREIFDYYRFTLESNPFIDNTELQLAVVLNNTVDSLTPGIINYADLVPNITVNTFLKSIEANFGCKFFIDYRLRTVNIFHLSEIFDMQSSPMSQPSQSTQPSQPSQSSQQSKIENQKSKIEKDLTAKLSSPISLNFSEPQKLILTVARSFSRSAVIADSHEQIISQTNPAEILLKRENQTFITSEFIRNVVYAYNRHNFYATERIETWENADRPTIFFYYKFVSSYFFDYSSHGNLKHYNVENNAESVNLICAVENRIDPFRMNLYWDVPHFEAGARRLHPATTLNDIPLIDGIENNDCPLSFLIVRGWVEPNYFSDPRPVYIRYLFASSFTTHPVADIEGPGQNHQINLTPTAIHDLWYRGFEDFLRNSNIAATCTIALNAVDINNLKWWEKIYLNNQPYFIDKINLTLTGDSDIRIDSIDLRTARIFAA